MSPSISTGKRLVWLLFFTHTRAMRGMACARARRAHHRCSVLPPYGKESFRLWRRYEVGILRCEQSRSILYKSLPAPIQYVYRHVNQVNILVSVFPAFFHQSARCLPPKRYYAMKVVHAICCWVTENMVLFSCHGTTLPKCAPHVVTISCLKRMGKVSSIT